MNSRKSKLDHYYSQKNQCREDKEGNFHLDVGEKKKRKKQTIWSEKPHTVKQGLNT